MAYTSVHTAHKSRNQKRHKRFESLTFSSSSAASRCLAPVTKNTEKNGVHLNRMEGNPLKQVCCPVRQIQFTSRGIECTWCVLCVSNSLPLQEMVTELLKWHFKEKSTKSQLCAPLHHSMRCMSICTHTIMHVFPFPLLVHYMAETSFYSVFEVLRIIVTLHFCSQQ